MTQLAGAGLKRSGADESGRERGKGPGLLGRAEAAVDAMAVEGLYAL